MLIERYRLEVDTSTHSMEEFEYEAIAYLDVDISKVMPYLNAVLQRGIYSPAKPVLAWRYKGRNIAFWPDKIAVDHLSSREGAVEEIERLIDLINEIWEKRDEIEADTTTHERLQPLELYRLLPQTNCGICGENTCFNFALKLAAGQIELQGCTPLGDESGYKEQLTALKELLATKWPIL
jgi:ArsR family metal-binding transcriptional regulator